MERVYAHDPVPRSCPDYQGAGGFEGVHTEPGDICNACGGTGEIDVYPDCKLWTSAAVQPSLLRLGRRPDSR